MFDGVGEGEDATPAVRDFLLKTWRDSRAFGLAALARGESESDTLAAFKAKIDTWPEEEQLVWDLFIRCIDNASALTRISPEVSKVFREVMDELDIRPLNADGMHRMAHRR